MIDEEIAEIRSIRHKISAQFAHDPRRVVAYYRALEKQLYESGEFKFSQMLVDSKNIQNSTQNTISD